MIIDGVCSVLLPVDRGLAVLWWVLLGNGRGGCRRGSCCCGCCCWASFSRKACCRVCTTSGITASIRDRDSMGRPSNTVPSSLMLISASTYCRPFCRMEMSAAGGTSVPLMLDWLIWLSIPNVNAEWEKPDSWRYRYTRKFTSSLVMLILASPRGDEVFTKQQPPPSLGRLHV